ncbi:MAG: hypothetical protein RQM92_06565 [Candidatus Syntrophopropionicum ammoniitolerans]
MKIYIQNEGLFICGRIKEVRELLIHYKNEAPDCQGANYGNV